MFFLQSERLYVLLYHVSPTLLLSSSTAASVDLCCHNSFHGVFVLSSHHAVPSQSGISYFVSNTCAFLNMTSFLFLSFSETPSIYWIILISVLSRSSSSLLVNLSGKRGEPWSASTELQDVSHYLTASLPLVTLLELSMHWLAHWKSGCS